MIRRSKKIIYTYNYTLYLQMLMRQLLLLYVILLSHVLWRWQECVVLMCCDCCVWMKIMKIKIRYTCYTNGQKIFRKTEKARYKRHCITVTKAKQADEHNQQQYE